MEELLRFLAEYHWLYDFKLTNLFLDEILEKIPDEWKTTLYILTLEELRDLPLGYTKDSWPDSLKDFIQKCVQFSVPRETIFQGLDGVMPLEPTAIDGSIRGGMSAKKLHEVCHMTSLVSHVTQEAGNNAVIDVGSGLGYLGQVLHSHYGLSILGLEGKQCHTAGADRRTQTVKCPHLSNVTCELHQTTESKQELSALCQQWFSSLPQEVATSCLYRQTGSQYCTSRKKVTKTGGNKARRMPSSLSSSATAISSLVSSSSSAISTPSQSLLLTDQKVPLLTTTVGLTPTSSTTTSSSLSSSNTTSLSAPSQSLLFTNSNASLSTTTIESITAHLQNPLSITSLTTITTSVSSSSSSTTTTSSSQSATTSGPVMPIHSFSKASCSIRTESEYESNHSNGRELTSLPTRCITNTTDSGNWKSSPDSGPGSMCMIGLHCCGDLTPTMLHMFQEIDWITSLCVVSCCYHRMVFEDATGCHNNFPMSDMVKKSLAGTRQDHPGWSLNTYSMRLAAQETRARWLQQTQDDHDLHTKNVAYRALLEICLKQGEVTLKRHSRRLARPADHATFDKYIACVQQHLDFSDTTDTTVYLETFSEQMHKLLNKYEELFPLIEPLTALQFLLQPVLETLIYKDRQLWLQEHGFHSNIVPVFDEAISPRNLALVAIKANKRLSISFFCSPGSYSINVLL